MTCDSKKANGLGKLDRGVGFEVMAGAACRAALKLAANRDVLDKAFETFLGAGTLKRFLELGQLAAAKNTARPISKVPPWTFSGETDLLALLSQARVVARESWQSFQPSRLCNEGKS